MRISDWSSDVCSSDLGGVNHGPRLARVGPPLHFVSRHGADRRTAAKRGNGPPLPLRPRSEFEADLDTVGRGLAGQTPHGIVELRDVGPRSEEHTSELQSLMRISYAVFCLKKKKQITNKPNKESRKETI